MFSVWTPFALSHVFIIVKPHAAYEQHAGTVSQVWNQALSQHQCTEKSVMKRKSAVAHPWSYSVESFHQAIKNWCHPATFYLKNPKYYSGSMKFKCYVVVFILWQIFKQMPYLLCELCIIEFQEILVILWQTDNQSWTSENSW